MRVFLYSSSRNPQQIREKHLKLNNIMQAGHSSPGRLLCQVPRENSRFSGKSNHPPWKHNKNLKSYPVWLLCWIMWLSFMLECEEGGGGCAWEIFYQKFWSHLVTIWVTLETYFKLFYVFFAFFQLQFEMFSICSHIYQPYAQLTHQLLPWTGIDF